MTQKISIMPSETVKELTPQSQYGDPYGFVVLAYFSPDRRWIDKGFFGGEPFRKEDRPYEAATICADTWIRSRGYSHVRIVQVGKP